MRLYWELGVRGFRRASAYRSAAVSGAITNTFFGFLYAYVFIALYRARDNVGGYSLSDALTYTFVAQGLISVVELWGWWRIAETIQSGQIATDLSRPFDYLAYWLAQDLGRAVFQALARGLPPIAGGALAFGIRIPDEPLIWLAFMASVTLAVIVSFFWRFLLNLTAFWLIDYRGVAGIGLSVVLVLSGFVVPLAMLPEPFRSVFYVLPFAGLVALPAEILLGRLSAGGVVGVLGLQAAWAFVALFAARAALRGALKKLVVQGG